MSRAAVALLGLALAAGACASGDDADGPGTTTTAAPATSTTTTTVVPLPASTRPVERGPVTADDPLRVTLVGDSVAFDAAKAVDEALTATGVVDTTVTTAFGMGFNPDSPVVAGEAIDELASGPPVDVVVVMLGAWDHLYRNRVGEAGYQALVAEAADDLATTASHVAWLAEPPSAPRLGEDELRRAVNEAFTRVADAVDGIDLVDLEPALTEGGEYRDRLDGPAGPDRLARKPDGRHLCPAGAALVAAEVVDAIRARWDVPPPADGWAVGAWWDDPRYDDPAGACSD